MTATLTPWIWIVEDDVDLAESMELLFKSASLPSCIHLPSGQACLDLVEVERMRALQPGCILLDIRLGDLSGTEVFAKLQSLQCPWPVIFMTGHGDLQMAVDLLRQGAFDYVTKPCEPMVLVEKVTQALALSHDRVQLINEQRQHLERLSSLTKHEQLVLQFILSHKTNREIAEEMNNSTRTIETHRANILKKMETSSALELAQFHERFLLRGGQVPFDTPM
jgi:two-component system response regulator DctR